MSNRTKEHDNGAAMCACEHSATEHHPDGQGYMRCRAEGCNCGWRTHKDAYLPSNRLVMTPREIAQFVADCRTLIAHSRTFYELRDALSKAVWLIESNMQPDETSDAQLSEAKEIIRVLLRGEKVNVDRMEALLGPAGSPLETPAAQKPVAWRKYADSAYELKPRWFYVTERPSVKPDEWEPLYAGATQEPSDRGLAEVRDRSANVALTCSGACRYSNGAFIADPACDTHGSQVKASGPIVVREHFCSHCKHNYGKHKPGCPFNATPGERDIS